MFVDYEELKKEIIGTKVPRPLSGTLSGHAAGEPFDKHVYKKIKNHLPDNTFRQYEYLNSLYTRNLDAQSTEARYNLFNSPTVLFLLSRGKNATDKWSLENPFEERQNDTADILVVKDGKYEVVDIKTRNVDKSAQPPNIISAYKLAQLSAKMIDNNDFDILKIVYFEVDWRLKEDFLVCEDAHVANLFKSNPENLYINWAAAMQIQFHVADLEEDFYGTTEEWVRLFLRHFVTQAKKRSEDMIDRFVKPFEKYLD